MERKRVYSYQGQSYQATIVSKRIRHIILRMDIEKKELRISCPYLTPLKDIDAMVTKHLPKYVKKNTAKPKPINNGEVYFLGSVHKVGDISKEEIESLLKNDGLPILEKRVRYFEKEMGVKVPYKVRVRKMKTRYGVNSKKTHSLTFQLDLLHYPIKIIDAVVVHELAHHFVFDHSKRFYDVVYKYCPDYKELHNKLRKGIFYE